MKKENGFLDITKIHEFMDLINNNEIFFHKHELVPLYNLICTFKDRLYTSINYLNNHSECPTTEEEFIIFLVFACMVYDGFNNIYEKVLQKTEAPPYKGKKKYFKNVKHFNEYYFNEETCPTDDVFFEYLRAMVFAHSYEVSCKGRPFIKKTEKQYCPWVVVNDIMCFDNIKDSVGIKVYTSVDYKQIITLTFPFNNLKQYIKSIYDSFSMVIEWAKNIICTQNEEWKLIKVNRRQDDVKILSEVRDILKSRYVDIFSINKTLSYLTCKTTNQKNNDNVEIFRKRIIKAIPIICDAVDNLDYEKMEEELSIIYAPPKNMHQMAHYQLEKIYTYLNERSENIDQFSNENWGLKQAYNFSREFAKKWVEIDVSTMQYDEIKMLVTVACYLEKEEQDRENNC